LADDRLKIRFSGGPLDGTVRAQPQDTVSFTIPVTRDGGQTFLTYKDTGRRTTMGHRIFEIEPHTA
jgi:hypothetical protein